MSNENIDWTSFRKRIVINKQMEEVYSAWTLPGSLTKWFLEKAEYVTPENVNRKPDKEIQTGDKHSWKWHNWDFTEEGEVLEANGTDKLSFTFGKGGNVHIHLKEAENGTELELVQNEIPTDDKSKMNYYVGCSTGWTFWLANLKAWLEHGITLHASGLSQDQTKDLVNS